jgi:amino acid transporter
LCKPFDANLTKNKVDRMSTKLRENALTYFESIFMGIAGTAVGISIATAIAGLLGTAGHVSPNALLIFAVPMLGIAFAYKGLNKIVSDAGAAYEWTKQGFGQFFGFFSGWALLVAALVYMVTVSVPLATATIDLFNPALASDVTLTTFIGAIWFLAIAVTSITGIGVTSKIQAFMTSIELLILVVIAVAAFIHAAHGGAVTPFSWSWFGFSYPQASFASSALIVVFLYWGWDVTSNLAEETKGKAAGNGGFVSVLVTIVLFVAFAVASLLIFSLKDAEGFSDNLIYHIALQVGLGQFGGVAASIAVIISSIAGLAMTMLLFSRTLFAMGRAGALPAFFGVVGEKTKTPVRAMYLLLGLGLVLIFGSSFFPSIASILTDSVNAIGVQVCYYYSLAGFVCAWLYRASVKTSPGTWLAYALFPLLSAVALVILGVYAFTTFNTMTKIVGLGGLLIGIIFYRPSGYGTHVAEILAEEEIIGTETSD